jgi:hypothetical protein
VRTRPTTLRPTPRPSSWSRPRTARTLVTSPSLSWARNSAQPITNVATTPG